MAPKLNKAPKKKERNVLGIGVKLKIINLLESKEKIAAIARKFNINESSVRSIRDNKKKIHQSASNMGNHAHLSKVVRNINIVKMEEMLMFWIQDLAKKKLPLDTRAIRQQAVDFYEHLEKKEPTKEFFAGSRGWYENFKNRFALHNLNFSGNLTFCAKKLLYLIIL